MYSKIRIFSTGTLYSDDESRSYDHTSSIGFLENAGRTINIICFGIFGKGSLKKRLWSCLTAHCSHSSSNITPQSGEHEITGILLSKTVTMSSIRSSSLNLISSTKLLRSLWRLLVCDANFLSGDHTDRT